MSALRGAASSAGACTSNRGVREAIFTLNRSLAQPRCQRRVCACSWGRTPDASVPSLGRSGMVAKAMMAGGETGMAPQLKQAIDSLIQQNKIVVFMKGTKQFPQCGFSNTVVQILRNLDAPFESVNILENEMLRSGMKEYSQWPTFPQVYIDGEFYGGCDIMIEAYQSGELAETLERLKNE